VASERKCTECKVRDSANRKGKPGRCVRCIDARYAQLGMKPLDPFVDSQSPRRCACLACGQIDKVAYAEIRGQLGHYCFWCACREMYEYGLAAEPQKWDITVEQAAGIVLGGEYVARAENGEVLDATGLAARMEHVWSPVEVNTRDFRCLRRTGLFRSSCLLPVYESVFVAPVVMCGHGSRPPVAAGGARSTVRGPGWRGGSSFLTVLVSVHG
jgi:hypothetical protein